MSSTLSLHMWFLIILSFTLTLEPRNTSAQEHWPDLPTRDATVNIPAQEWRFKPGPRKVRISVYYPNGTVTGVDKNCGIMLSLHNWGGTDCAGTANPRELARRLNVVAICVNYLQSGKDDVDLPYDFGYFQALDALRALWFVADGLAEYGHEFNSSRIYATGGSGGGNVTLMVNKLAPRTFTCVIDMCGMNKLSDDIAFGSKGGSGLNARWNPDQAHPHFLSKDHQSIRFVGNKRHLKKMKSLNSSCKILVVHGRDDTTCPFPDAEEMVENLESAGLEVEAYFIGKSDLDGKVFTSSGHPLGNRTEIVFRVAGNYILPTSQGLLKRDTPSDFELRESVEYNTDSGRFVIDYSRGYPVGSFIASAPSQVPTKINSQFRRWDKNNDNKLTRDELPLNRRGVFGRVDTNNDGFISPLEDRAFRSRGQQNTQRSRFRLPDGAVAHRDLAYVENGHERHKLDIYLPADTGKPVPLVLWVHGGGWRNGSKNGGPFLPLLTKGIAVASINYRLSGHAQFPAQLHDCKAAIRWLRAHAQEYRLDPTRFGAWGSSAGGHLVAMIGVTSDVPELEGDLGNTDQSSAVQAVCDWFGPTDFLLMNQHAGNQGAIDHDAPRSPESLLIGGAIQDHKERARRASPLSYISSTDPPVLIIHGDRDLLVPLPQSKLFLQKLTKSGVAARLMIVKDAAHGQFRESAPRDASIRFFETRLKP